jgi:hypothetical protein
MQPQPPTAAAAPADPVKSAGIMLCVAAALILVGTVSKSWFAGGDGRFQAKIGPMGVEVCMGSRCMDGGGRGIDDDVQIFMTWAMLGGFAAAAAAGLFGGMAVAGKKDKVPEPKIAKIAFGVALGGMLGFVIRVLAEGGKGDINPSWAGVPGIGGVILAYVGMGKLRPFLQARTSAPGQGPHQMPPQGQPYGQPYGQPMSPQGGQPMNPQGGSPMQYPQNQSSQPMQPQPQLAAPHVPPPQGAAPQPQQHACPRCGTPLHFVAQYQRWFCPREQQYV